MTGAAPLPGHGSKPVDEDSSLSSEVVVAIWRKSVRDRHAGLEATIGRLGDERIPGLSPARAGLIAAGYLANHSAEGRGAAFWERCFAAVHAAARRGPDHPRHGDFAGR
jgi:hypothetical protein